MNQISWKRTCVAAALVGALVTVQPATVAAAEHSAGVYVATGLVNLLYIPAKVAFAAGGAVVSGLTYVFTAGNDAATSSVWRSSVEGNYVVTPRMIEGKQSIHFVGP